MQRAPITIFNLPLVMTLAALELSCSAAQTIVAAAHTNRHTIDKRIGHVVSGALNDAPERCPRDPHLTTGIFMAKPVQIR